MQANFLKTQFSSRSQLNELLFPLTQDQLANCIFEDEQEFYNKQAEETYYSEKETNTPAAQHDKNSLKIHFKDHTSWTPRDMSLFLGALHLSYANTFYLLNTEDNNLERISFVLDNNVYNPPLNFEISVSYINIGSLEVILTLLDKASKSNFNKVLASLLIMGKLIVPISEATKNFSEAALINEQRLSLKEIRDKDLAVINNNYADIMKKNLDEYLQYINNLKDNPTIHEIIAKADIKNATVIENPDIFVNATAPLSRALLALSKTGKTNPKITLPIIENEEAPNK
ncbi:hypothetical protein [Maridesulfovibrio frigidus]|uniref:hypothetical protein n=1 Tax=Maridesulfovibrio frigidus TaxID=340956 RepID=UPI00068F2728|nr:hypothetical protein [Maridesulfovibrio frigidus]